MTDEEWLEIAEAWVKWLRNEGPPVQYLNGTWHDWTGKTNLDRYWLPTRHPDGCKNWRIKPEPKRARMCMVPVCGGYIVEVVDWCPGSPEPVSPPSKRASWIPGHDWVEIPEFPE